MRSPRRSALPARLARTQPPRRIVVASLSFGSRPVRPSSRCSMGRSFVVASASAPAHCSFRRGASSGLARSSAAACVGWLATPDLRSLDTISYPRYRNAVRNRERCSPHQHARSGLDEPSATLGQRHHRRSTFVLSRCEPRLVVDDDGPGSSCLAMYADFELDPQLSGYSPRAGQIAQWELARLRRATTATPASAASDPTLLAWCVFGANAIEPWSYPTRWFQNNTDKTQREEWR